MPRIRSANISQNILTGTLNVSTINVSTITLANGQDLAGTGNLAYNQANAARDQANTARDQANSAYLAANNANLLLGGVITGTLNVTQDIIVGGNVYLEGNTTFINVATYSVEDSLIYLASNNSLTDSVDIGFVGAKNTSGTFSHTGLARDATDGKWKLFDGLPDSGHVGNVIDFNNSYLATLVANVEANTLSVVNGVSGNVNFDAGTLFVDSVGNRVGIGTTNPAYKVDVNGIVNIAQGSYLRKAFADNTEEFLIRGDATVWNGFISYTPSSGTSNRGFKFGAWDNVGSRSDWVTFWNGNVGIGITNPSYRLVVSNSGGVGGEFDPTGVQIGGGFGIQAYNRATSQYVPFQLYGSAIYLMGGNVGVGTANPSRTLHVYGTAKIGTGGAGSGTALTINQGINNQVNITHGSSSDWGLLLGFGDGTLSTNYHGLNHAALINVQNAPLHIGTNNTSRITILGNGDVGIGTVSPGRRFHTYVNGADVARFEGSLYYIDIDGNGNQITGSNGLAFRGTTTGGAHLQITSGGNVGIGTASPQNLFHVSGSSQNVRFSNFSTDSAGLLISYQNSSTHGLHLMYRPNDATCYIESTYQASAGTVYGDLIFRQNVAGTMTPRMTIKADGGNVGIGTNNPGGRLHVFGGPFLVEPSAGRYWFSGVDGVGHYIEQVGTSAAERVFRIQNSNGSGTYTQLFLDGTNQRIYTNSGVNVGIGTTNPAARLNVQVAAPTGVGAIPSGTTAVFENAGNNYITMRHTADGGFYSGIVFLDNNIGGYVVHGDGNNGDKLYLAGYQGVEIQQGSASSVTPGARTTIGNFTSSGLTVTGTITETSSIRIKENINPITDALRKVLSMNGYTYDRIDGTAKQRAGLIAEEVEQVLPNVVQKDAEGLPYGIQYTNLIAYLIESIKELKAEIDELKRK